MNKEEYQKYLKSWHWIDFRHAVFCQRNKVSCEKCGTKRGLQIHHKHYNSLYHEKRSDVLVLCGKCHREIHGLPEPGKYRMVKYDPKPIYRDRRYKGLKYESLVKKYSRVLKVSDKEKREYQIERLVHQCRRFIFSPNPPQQIKHIEVMLSHLQS